VRETQKRVWGLLAPTLILLIFLGVIPIIYILYLSVYKYNVFSKVGMVYTGFNNFRKLVFDPDFLKSLRLGLSYVLLCVAIELPLGLAFANLLTYNYKGKGIFRTIMTLPLAMAPISIGAIWVLMTNPDFGPLAFSAALWVMPLGALGWMIVGAALTHKLEFIRLKLAGGKIAFLPVLTSAAMLGVFAKMGSAELIAGGGRTIAFIIGLVCMIAFLRLADAINKTWIKEWSLGFSMLIGMFVAAAFF